MGTYGAENKVDAARHEAAHAVIGVRAGGSLSSIYIMLNGDRWVGDCRFEKGEVSAENLAAGAIAGCLAQAKCCAEREYGQDVCFDKDVYSKDLVHILRDEDRSSPDVVPGRCELGFLAKNRPVTSCLEGAWFSGMDAGQYRMARRALFPMDSTDRQLVRSVLVELDEARNWRAICRIADALCSQPPSDDGRLILEGTTVVRMIQESDAENEQKTTDE